MTPRVMSTMFAALIRELGYDRFGAAGCDWGAYVTALLGLDHPDRARRDPHGDAQLPRARLRTHARRCCVRARAKAWRSEESGYSTIQGTKPQSLAYGLTDSPAGLAGWIVEKWRRWSDCDGDVQRLFTRDELLTTIAIYWFTRHDQQRQPPVLREPAPPRRPRGGPARVLPPAGFLVEREVDGATPNIGPPPRSRAEAIYDVQRWTVPDHGLHFPAVETPDLYVEELRAFFRHLR